MIGRESEYTNVIGRPGDAVGSLAEFSAPDALPLQLQGGHVIELVPPPPPSPARAAESGANTKKATATASWDEHRPGILGAPYVAPLAGVARAETRLSNCLKHVVWLRLVEMLN